MDNDVIENIPISNIPQPPSNATKPNNIRRQTRRLSSEPSGHSMESKICRRENEIKPSISISLASVCPARSPESSNISFETGYDSSNNAHGIHHSLSLSSMERK